jgi:hypothetical protein
VPDDVIAEAYAAVEQTRLIRPQTDEVASSYPFALDSSGYNPEYPAMLLERLHPGCLTLKGAGKGVRMPNNLALMRIGGASGNPIIKDVVCSYHRRAPGMPYAKPGGIAHRFCSKEQGDEYPDGCQGIVTDYMYMYILKNIDSLYEESKRLNSQIASGAPLTTVDQMRASHIARVKARAAETAAREAAAAAEAAAREAAAREAAAAGDAAESQ